MTVGATQYLYWITTAPKEKETDPDVYRISGVYYDAQTGSMSDLMVFAECSIPEDFSWVWDNQKWNFVPTGVILSQQGWGYIATKPKAITEKYTGFVPMNMYRFKLSLKPVANLKGVSVMDSAVAQGSFASADMAIMNEGNMGIGSFVADVILMEGGREKEVVETLYANCLYPGDSRLVMTEGNRTVATGEAALYRYKDFIYTPRQQEWNVQEQTKTYRMRGKTLEGVTDGSSGISRITTNVVVPGALGGFGTSIKIPSDWHGRYELRVRIREVSTYTNWLSASALAKDRPELFALYSAPAAGNGVLRASARDAVRSAQLTAKGIQRLDYVLNEGQDRMLLKVTDRPTLMMASSAGAPGGEGDAVPVQAGDAATDFSDGILLYSTEIKAPEPVSVEVDVHDIDVSHRVFEDYYGDENLEITIHNYYNNEQPIRLYCLVYDDDAGTSACRMIRAAFPAAGRRRSPSRSPR